MGIVDGTVTSTNRNRGLRAKMRVSSPVADGIGLNAASSRPPTAGGKPKGERASFNKPTSERLYPASMYVCSSRAIRFQLHKEIAPVAYLSCGRATSEWIINPQAYCPWLEEAR